ncbi:hypothetical protein CBOM_07904 [Ceraceosorus bombacis]|uniref:Uncharacterized protein n=1 Tax=Ceraceosorus bombacis TaxID=401625 RepID=A0A0P1BPW4_9BASI|nr:hypothetical protein CBOM_07904 [Ceraceosorus bombacis]
MTRGTGHGCQCRRSETLARRFDSGVLTSWWNVEICASQLGVRAFRFSAFARLAIVRSRRG